MSAMRSARSALRITLASLLLLLLPLEDILFRPTRPLATLLRPPDDPEEEEEEGLGDALPMPSTSARLLATLPLLLRPPGEGDSEEEGSVLSTPTAAGNDAAGAGSLRPSIRS